MIRLQTMLHGSRLIANLAGRKIHNKRIQIRHGGSRQITNLPRRRPIARAAGPQNHTNSRRLYAPLLHTLFQLLQLFRRQAGELRNLLSGHPGGKQLSGDRQLSSDFALD